MLIASAGLFGIFLFLTYYLQQTLGYSPLVTGARVPADDRGGLIVTANLSTIVLMPRVGPKPLVASGMLAAAAGTGLAGPGSARTPAMPTGVLGPLILAGIGLGMVIAPAINTGTFGVAPQDAGVASATVTIGQHARRLGRHLAAEHHLRQRRRLLPDAAHLAAARIIGRQRPDRAGAGARLRHRVLVDRRHLRRGAVIGGALLRPGPLVPTGTPSRAQTEVPTAQAETGPALVTAPRANRLIDLRGFLIHCPVLASARSWVICAVTIMVDGCAGVRSASIWRTQSQALPPCPSVVSMVDE